MTRLTIQATTAIDETGLKVLPEPVDIFIENGFIKSISPTGITPPEGRVIDGTNTLTSPGLINGHHHSHENFHKGRYDRLPLELWMNFVRPAKGLPLTPDDIYLRTLIGASQALLSGTTCIVDDFNASPILSREHLDAAFAAYDDIGIRALVGPTLFDVPFHESVPYLSEECDAKLLSAFKPAKATPIAEYLKLLESLACSHHPHNSRVGIIMAPSAPQRCSDGLLKQVREFADQYDLPTIIHVQETRLQASSAWQQRGKTLFRHLDDIGFLAPGTSLIHSVWLTPDDIKRIAASGASVQHNPNSNLKLGSGLMPMRQLLDAGVNVSLGTDGCGSLETTDMLRVLSSTALIHKLRGNDYQNWIGAEEAFHAATKGGAQALGLNNQIGTLAPGYKADLVMYRLDSPAFVPLNNPVQQLVYGESGIGIHSVIVEGNPVVSEGKLTLKSETEISAGVSQAMNRLRPHIEEAEQSTRLLAPAYQRIWQRCQKLPLAPGTIPARFE
jgi:5-methylthioadenosine/S-adenosylhomocysteine deaminase